MSATSQYARQVTTTVLQNPVEGTYAIVSSELPGLFLSGKDLATLTADVPNAIKMLYLVDCGIKVEVLPVEDAPVGLTDGWKPTAGKFVTLEQRAS